MLAIPPKAERFLLRAAVLASVLASKSIVTRPTRAEAPVAGCRDACASTCALVRFAGGAATGEGRVGCLLSLTAALGGDAPIDSYDGGASVGSAANVLDELTLAVGDEEADAVEFRCGLLANGMLGWTQVPCCAA